MITLHVVCDRKTLRFMPPMSANQMETGFHAKSVFNGFFTLEVAVGAHDPPSRDL